MIRVCHLTSVHKPFDDRIFLKECVSLAQAGYEVYLIAMGESIEKDGVKIIGYGSVDSKRIKRIMKTTKEIYNKALELDCDIYHFHDPELLPYGLKLKKLGKKVIFDSHEDIPAQIKDKVWICKYIRYLISFIYKMYETYAVGKLDAVIAATPFIGMKFRGRAKRVVVLNNYPKLDDIVFQKRDFIKRDKIVCYAGGISKARGEDVMVAAMKEVDGILILAGAHKEITDGKKIKYVGFLNRGELNEVYGSARVAISILEPLENYIKSQPIKIYEYMAAGLPVVASDFEDWKEVIVGGGAGICVNPLDKKEVAKALNYLLENPNLAQQMGIKGREMVVEQYNWSNENVKLIDLYKKLSGAN